MNLSAITLPTAANLSWFLGPPRRALARLDRAEPRAKIGSTNYSDRHSPCASGRELRNYPCIRATERASERTRPLGSLAVLRASLSSVVSVFRPLTGVAPEFRLEAIAVRPSLLCQKATDGVDGPFGTALPN